MSATFPFLQFALDASAVDWFARLSEGVYWERVTKGREGAVLLARTPDGSAPIVRSTTKYRRPHQRFTSVHQDLLTAVAEHAPGLCFNNALIERYTSQYRTMGAHSDQALDLDDDSYICLYSCYSQPGVDTRLLVVTDKVSGEEQVLVLGHCTAVLFSVQDNARYRHRIVAEGISSNDCVWLGVTLRCSKTVVHYSDGKAHMEGQELILFPTKDDEREFYKQRGLENRCVCASPYSAAVASCTISPSDLMAPLED